MVERMRSASDISLKSLAGQLTQVSGKAIAVAAETDSHQVKQLVDKVVQAFARIDVMINNAGLIPHSPLERLKIAIPADSFAQAAPTR